MAPSSVHSQIFYKAVDSSLKLTEEQLHFIQIRVNINRKFWFAFSERDKKKKEALWGLYNTALISRSKQLKNNKQNC